MGCAASAQGQTTNAALDFLEKAKKVVGYDAVIKLSDGRELNKQQLFEEAIKADPQCAEAYRGLGKAATAVNDLLKAREMYIEALKRDAKNSAAYTSLAATIENGIDKVKLFDGRELGKMDLLTEAIKHDATYGKAYAQLSASLENFEVTVTLPDGRTLNKRQLIDEAIKTGNNLADGYRELANSLEATATAMLPDGRTLDRVALYVESLKHDANAYLTYYALGLATKAKETVTLATGKAVTRAELFVESLRINQRMGEAYLELAATLENLVDTVKIAEDKILNKQQLLVAAVNNGVKDVKRAYRELAETTPPEQPEFKITFTTGRSMTRAELLIAAQ